jgi:hypothetical protein
MLVQQSALIEQGSSQILHVPPPQTPLKQPSEQQFCARMHGTPSAEHDVLQILLGDKGSS